MSTQVRDDHVHLEPYEVALACQVGMRRHMQALARGLRDAHGLENPTWDLHIEGAAGEMAVAKHLGVYWDGSVNTFKVPDVGAIQVRTRSNDTYELLVRPGDADDEPFVLVTGTIPHFRVVGWLRGKDAKRPEWLRNHGGRPAAYFVPQAELRPVGTILAG